MANTYTELIERLYKHYEDYANGKTQDFRAVFSDCVHAADAIETLSNGINAYSDEAFKRAQECADLRRRIAELVEKYEKEAACAPDPAPAPSPATLYICDRRACDRCNPDCKHTTDIRHAYHFEVGHFGGFVESEY